MAKTSFRVGTRTIAVSVPDTPKGDVVIIDNTGFRADVPRGMFAKATLSALLGADGPAKARAQRQMANCLDDFGCGSRRART